MVQKPHSARRITPNRTGNVTAIAVMDKSERVSRGLGGWVITFRPGGEGKGEGRIAELGNHQNRKKGIFMSVGTRESERKHPSKQNWKFYIYNPFPFS